MLQHKITFTPVGLHSTACMRLHRAACLQPGSPICMPALAPLRYREAHSSTAGWKQLAVRHVLVCWVVYPLCKALTSMWSRR